MVARALVLVGAESGAGTCAGLGLALAKVAKMAKITRRGSGQEHREKL
jgi:hypothetical protein